ncbi:MAG: hypothetical protein S4CHLAM6_15130 [Chlamydiae bacterium]|nr:hypothetical protein [Chlamydiota bacterium]
MQFEIIHYIQQLNHPYFISFVKFLNFFDRIEFLFVLLPFTWIFIGRKAGLRIFSIFILNASICNLFKNFFAHPRPFHIDPSIGIIQVSGFSFPSGAAQTSALLATLTLVLWKNKFKWIVAPIYFAAICFSRVYLGVHFPKDILAGAIVGLALSSVYFYIFPKLEKFITNFSPLLITLFTTVLFSSLTLLSTETPYILFFSAAVSFYIGYYVSTLVHPTEVKKSVLSKTLIDLPLTIFGTFFMYSLTQSMHLHSTKLQLFIQCSLLGLWISFISGYLALNIYRAAQKLRKQVQA